MIPPMQVHPPRRRRARAIDRESLALALVLTALGAVRVVIALACHQAFGAEATIALGVLVFGLAGLRDALRGP